MYHDDNKVQKYTYIKYRVISTSFVNYFKKNTNIYYQYE